MQGDHADTDAIDYSDLEAKCAPQSSSPTLTRARPHAQRPRVDGSMR